MVCEWAWNEDKNQSLREEKEWSGGWWNVTTKRERGGRVGDRRRRHVHGNGRVCLGAAAETVGDAITGVLWGKAARTRESYETTFTSLEGANTADIGWRPDTAGCEDQLSVLQSEALTIFIGECCWTVHDGHFLRLRLICLCVCMCVCVRV
jgi:hypothetical protein